LWGGGGGQGVSLFCRFRFCENLGNPFRFC